MRVLVVSTNAQTQLQNTAAIRLAFPEAEEATFVDPLLAVKHNLSWKAEVVICDFALRIIDGIQLVRLLWQQDEDIIPILIDADGVHSRDADNLAISHTFAPEALEFRKIWEGETYSQA